MLVLDYRRLSWWYWLITVCLLTMGIAGRPTAFAWAIGITVVQLLHFIVRERGLTAFPVQVRAGYLTLLLISWPSPMQWLYWLPTLGTWAQVLFGYCPLARMLSLLPWNRQQPLSLALVKRVFLAAPVRGSVLQGHA